MRLVGLLLMLLGGGIGWELWWKGRPPAEALANVAGTFGLRQLAQTAGASAAAAAAGNASQATAGTLRPSGPR